jgi:hypothetical protein
VAAEGWFRDPFALHDARWFSDGSPTDLVRDGSSDSSDPPPDTAISTTLEPITSHASLGPFVESGFSDGPMDSELIFRVNNKRGCFSILGLWIASVAGFILPLFIFAGRGWTLIAIAIELAMIILLSGILYHRRRSRQPSS